MVSLLSAHLARNNIKPIIAELSVHFRAGIVDPAMSVSCSLNHDYLVPHQWIVYGFVIYISESVVNTERFQVTSQLRRSFETCGYGSCTVLHLKRVAIRDPWLLKNMKGDIG